MARQCQERARQRYKRPAPCGGVIQEIIQGQEEDGDHQRGIGMRPEQPADVEGGKNPDRPAQEGSEGAERTVAVIRGSLVFHALTRPPRNEYTPPSPGTAVVVIPGSLVCHALTRREYTPPSPGGRGGAAEEEEHGHGGDPEAERGHGPAGEIGIDDVVNPMGGVEEFGLAVGEDGEAAVDVGVPLGDGAALILLELPGDELGPDVALDAIALEAQIHAAGVEGGEDAGESGGVEDAAGTQAPEEDDEDDGVADGGGELRSDARA